MQTVLKLDRPINARHLAKWKLFRFYLCIFYFSKFIFPNCIQILSVPFIPSTSEVTTFKFNSSWRLRRSGLPLHLINHQKIITLISQTSVNLLWSWSDKQKTWEIKIGKQDSSTAANLHRLWDRILKSIKPSLDI